MILIQLGAAYFSETKMLTKILPLTRRPDFVEERDSCVSSSLQLQNLS